MDNEVKSDDRLKDKPATAGGFNKSGIIVPVGCSILTEDADGFRIDRPNDKKANANIWSVYSNEFDIGELNSYLLTYDKAVKMCVNAYNAGEGDSFRITTIPRKTWIKTK